MLDDKRKTAEALLGALANPQGEAGWAREVRARARARLLDAGAPIRRDEYWRYTNPTGLTQTQGPALALAETPPYSLPFADAQARVARFVNGRRRADLSDALEQDGLTVTPLAEALCRDITFAREVFGVLEAEGQEKVARPLASLNTAAATEGLALHVTGPVAVPLHIDQCRIGEGAALLHHVVRVETGGSLTVLESGLSSNTVLEVDLAPGGVFRHIRLQSAPGQPTVSHIFARIGDGAQFKTFTMTADGHLTRNEIVTDLRGNDASSHVAGAVLGSGESHADNTIFITHTGLNGESRQVFKSVLADEARGIFQGKIFVRQGAQKTDGYQISQAVLLSDGAEFSAKPELEIYADDVKCSHGSTTGALDETALFYLRSRGVTRRVAEALLVASFVEEAIAEIDDPAFGDAMRAEVAAWMARRV
jgi:Fe-S cluster assembly protein SufD